MLYDVIIIGAGSMGMSAGYYLTRAGKSVALIDSHDPPHSEGSHHGESRIIRHAYGEGAKYVPMALRAQELWYELEKTAGIKVFEQTGVLNIGTKNSEFLQNVIQSAHAFKLSIEELSALEINKRWPGFHLAENLMGCFEKNSGVLMSERAISAFRKLAVNHGAHLYTNRSVQAIETGIENITVQLTDKSIVGKKLIISAGKGTNQVTSLLGKKMPLTFIRKTFSWYDSNKKFYHPSAFPAWSFNNEKSTYYGFPSINDAGIKIGRHDSGHSTNVNETLKPFGCYPEDQDDVAQFAAQHMSAQVQHKQGKVCTYTNSPDGDFIIDRLPGHENIVIACGFSGHGFKFSTAIGEILSQMVVHGQPSLDISYFHLNRF